MQQGVYIFSQRFLMVYHHQNVCHVSGLSDILCSMTTWCCPGDLEAPFQSKCLLGFITVSLQDKSHRSPPPPSKSSIYNQSFYFAKQSCTLTSERRKKMLSLSWKEVCSQSQSGIARMSSAGAASSAERNDPFDIAHLRFGVRNSGGKELNTIKM